MNAKLYVDTLLPKLVVDCKTSTSFIFQQDGAAAHTHTAREAQDWITTNYTEFIGQDEWPVATDLIHWTVQ